MVREAASVWRDSPAGYGRISRTFHWGMAMLFAWQFTSAALHFFAPDTPAEEFFFSRHFDVGFLLWCLIWLRGLWGLANLSRRPAHAGPAGLRRAATLGHLALYLLMIAVPSIALLRAYGSERGFSALGIEIFAPQESEIEWMVELGGALHGELGWTLMAVVAGHVAIALWHGFVRHDGTLGRMWRGRETEPAR